MTQAAVILAGILALFFWLRSFDVASSARYLAAANLGWILVFVAIHFVTITLRAFRWRTIIYPLCPLPLRTAGEIYFLGEFVNASFAMRSGDVAKAAMLRQEGGLPVMSGLSLLFADKIFELWGLISVTALGFVLVLAASESLGGVSGPVLAFYPILMISMIAVLRIMATDWADRLICRFSERPGLIGRIAGLVHHGAVGLRAAAQLPRRQLIGLALLSSLIYAIDGFSLILLFWSVGTDVSAGKVLLAGCMVALIFVLPAPPGYVGTLEGGFAVFFGQLGVASNEAIAAVAILFHATLYLSLLLLGIGSFRRYRALMRTARPAEPVNVYPPLESVPRAVPTHREAS